MAALEWWLLHAVMALFALVLAWAGCVAVSLLRGRQLWWGDQWVPRAAEVAIALGMSDARSSERRRRCVRCGSGELRTVLCGLWDGVPDASGVRPGGAFWYGECECCGCRLGSYDPAEGPYEAAEEEWESQTVFPWTQDQRRMAGPAAWPGTVKEAVRRLMEDLPAEERDLVRGTPGEADLAALHFVLGLTVRNDFGLRGGNVRLLEDCGIAGDVEDPSGLASAVILRALRARLLETASAAGMERARERWAAFVATGRAGVAG